MARITFQEAPLQMKNGIVGIGEHHDNHWGRMLVLKLLQCEGARFLLIENATDKQGMVDAITTPAGAIDAAAAQQLDAHNWKETGVLTTSTVIYQAQKRGVRVVCADHTCVYSGSYATGKAGMNKRNQFAADTLLGLATSPAELKGVIMLNGVEHFEGTMSTSIPSCLESTQGINFGWVDASTKAGSGFGVELGG